MIKQTSIKFLSLAFLLTLTRCIACPAEKPTAPPQPQDIPKQAQQTPAPAQNQAFEIFKKLFLQSYLPQDILPGDESMTATLPATAIESMPADYAGDPNQYKPTSPFLAGTGCCEFFPGFHYETTPTYIALVYRQTNGVGDGSEYFVLITYAPDGKPIDHKQIAFKEGDIEFENSQTATLEGNHQISARKTEVRYMIADSGERQPTSKKETFITYQISADGKISMTESATPQ